MRLPCQRPGPAQGALKGARCRPARPDGCSPCQPRCTHGEERRLRREFPLGRVAGRSRAVRFNVSVTLCCTTMSLAERRRTAAPPRPRRSTRDIPDPTAPRRMQAACQRRPELEVVTCVRNKGRGEPAHTRMPGSPRNSGVCQPRQRTHGRSAQERRNTTQRKAKQGNRGNYLPVRWQLKIDPCQRR